MVTEVASHIYLGIVDEARRIMRSDEEGQGMIEYGLLVALISIAAIAVITLIGPQLKGIFQQVVNSL